MSEENLKIPRGHLLTGQLPHLLLLIALIPGVYQLAGPALGGGVWLGLRDAEWLRFMLVVVVAHQVIVALVFRLQLVYGCMTRLFGSKDMVVWGAIFLPLLALRVVTVVGLGLATRGSLGIPEVFAVPAGLLLLVPAIATLYSVFAYFGLARALGGDHFRKKYRQMPFERRGMFRYSSNAMYTYAFLGLWAAALLTGSRAALAAALFQHAYIWVHWYCTEAPDIEVIFGSGREGES